MFEFLNDFARAIESAGDKQRKSSIVKPSDSASNSGFGKVMNVQLKKNYGECGLCKGNHRLIQCEKFNQLTPEESKEKVMSLRLCLNCFSPHHFVRECTKASSCRQCHGKHHSLLHFMVLNPVDSAVRPGGTATVPEASSTSPKQAYFSLCMGNRLKEKEVLLSTAIVKVDSSNGQSVLCRLLVDHGSQVHFITQGCFQRLGLQRKVAEKGLTVNGIGGVTKGTLTDYVYCDIRPWFDSSFSVTVKICWTKLLMAKFLVVL